MARSKEFDVDVALRRAMDLFWDQGYERTSMQELVDHMGIHRKSLYDTFGDKHELFIQAVERYRQMVRYKIERRMNQNVSAKEAIRSLFQMTIDEPEFQSKGCFIVNTAVELCLHDVEAAKMVQESFESNEKNFYDLIVRGQRTGEIPVEHDAVKLSQYLMNAWTGIRVLVKSSLDNERLENIINTTMEMLN